MKRNLTGNVLEKSTMENWKKQASKERLLLLKTFTLASALQVIPQNLSTLLISTHGHGGLLARNRISTFFCHGLDSILLSSFPYLIYSRAFGLKIGIIHFHPFGTHTTLRKIPLCVSSSYFLEWSPHLHCHRLKVKGKLPFVH